MPDTPERKNAKPTKESHKLIKQAADMAAQHVRDVVAPHNKAAQKAELNRWVKFIRNEAQVVVLSVPDDVDAYLLFETLNDRGLKASQADLLKNYLLSQTKNGMAEGQHKWAQMTGALESLRQDDVTVKYLHHLLITLHGPTRAAEIFGKVKDTVKGPGSFSSRGSGDEGQSRSGLGGVVATGGGDVGGARRAQEAKGRVAQRGHDLGDGPAAHLGPIFIEGHVADPVGAVFDVPMVTQEVEDLPCPRPLGGEAGHAVDPFVALLARLLEGDVALDNEDLACPRPRAVSGEQCPQRQTTPLDAPMAKVEGLRRLGRRGQVRRR